MAGRKFDAQVVHTPFDSPRGQLMAQYVCIRTTQLDDVDIALFDYDRHNTLYYFLMNASEYIYTRYGGRDERAPESYLDLRSLELALAKGLELHAQHKAGQLPPQTRPEPRFPKDIPLLRTEVMERGRCVECHLVGDYELMEQELAGELTPQVKLERMYRSPDIRTIGIELDVAKGLVIANATGAVAEAGMRTGDRVIALNRTPVYTFADLQYHYDQMPRNAKEVTLTVERDGATHDLAVALPLEWWKTDLYHRFLSVDPQAGFVARRLTADERAEQGLHPQGFAAEVTEIDSSAKAFNVHSLQVGDVVYSVNGVEHNDLTTDIVAYIKLFTTAGEPFKLGYIRDGERLEMDAETRRWDFRKPKW
ncbi:MAG: Trx7/PDZ domain-containing (seleno)protein [Candidatus Hydrogenedentales bacterium]